MNGLATVARGLLVAGIFSSMATGCSDARPASGPADAGSTTASRGVSTDPRVNAVLVRSCYNCHSTEGSTPWYAAISPTRLAANSARKVLNFSEWGTYDAPTRASALAGITQSVSSGSMPPGDYTILDHSARLTEEDKQMLLEWASQAMPAQ
jgi:hypothetical protein